MHNVEGDDKEQKEDSSSQNKSWQQRALCG
jgi:hypothetical protein